LQALAPLVTEVARADGVLNLTFAGEIDRSLLDQLIALEERCSPSSALPTTTRHTDSRSLLMTNTKARSTTSCSITLVGSFGDRGLRGPALLDPNVWVYASFAAGPDGGNPAGVVASPEPIATRTAQSLAAVLSVPTTGFVLLDDAAANGSASVRFFTPDQEIDACGHVTVAIATALADRGTWQWGSETLVSASGGEFPLRLRDGRVEMEQRLQALERTDIDWSDITAALGPIRPRPELPLSVAGTGLRHLIVPLADAAALSELALDRKRITALAERSEADTICVWAPAAGRNRARMRDLCARIGALEEPASGTTAGALALYLAELGQLDGPELTIEQGVEMGRPSRIDVLVAASNAVVVRGEARKVLAGRLELPTPESA
jgi:trans-2,3-dihydro-3-hydroxyanthranilate isomerase